ncbi:glycosyltransferase family 9 protein [Escherichia albertii]|uniref:glycosyltransferase family 9 protein n=1 Tax=Escherichia albertii TaxID=208962 RepID=UPI00235E97B1|nr:glycosyltransferase family 9 protein [Escherichia albertii]WDC32634.1 glycosyltransferase family 9 protein [Escherichia albertii]
MILQTMFRNIIYKIYDYKAQNIHADDIKFVVIHIPDQIGDAMAIYPLIRALEKHPIAHLIIVASSINQPVFDALELNQTKLTVMSMAMQDHASVDEIKKVATIIKEQYGTPDLCIEAMRKKNFKAMIFISTLKARVNFQVVGLSQKCYSPVCRIASRMDQSLRAPVPMTWATLMREAGFPCVPARYEFPLSEEVLTEVRRETFVLGRYIALNLEGSIAARTFSYSVAQNLITIIQQECDMPIVIVHGPKGVDSAIKLTELCSNVFRLSLSPSLMRSAAVIKDAYLAITPDTSILHMTSAYNTPAIAVYADYKTRWPSMQDIAENIVVGRNIDCINLKEFEATLRRILSRING